MHATAQALLEAHTRHVMQQLSGDALKALVAEETAEACNWMASRPVNALATPAFVRDFLLRNVFDVVPGDALLEQIGTLATRAFKSPLNAETRVDALLTRDDYDFIVNEVIARESVRNEIIHTVMQNHEITHLISDIVYSGIKNYLAENSKLANKVPGVGSLLKVGKGVMERMGTDSMVEGALKGYIHQNTRSTMEMTERLIKQALESHKLKASSQKLWDQVHARRLDLATKHVSEQDVRNVVTIGNRLWNHFRQTGYARGLLNELVEAWFSEHGGDSLMSVLESIGLDRSRLPQEVQLFLEPLLADLVSSGQLEGRVRVHLERFYGSADVASLLGK
ncbi:MAG TPA: hypothetical protein VFM34_07295 [Moraxellaceae bacterium]|nr:hypothetical protein [Moraxellaceae bacterium]